MRVTLEREVVKAGDLASVVPGAPARRSVAIHAMLEKGLLAQDARGPRFYRVPLSREPFGMFVVRQLDALGYLPRILKDDGLAEPHP